jgi:CrcB protein
MNIYSLLAVGAGGFLGSVGRYLCVLYVDRIVNSRFPFGTLLVNIVGSFLLGLFIGMSLRDRQKLFLATGFCGGFTTFSAFAFENSNLVDQKLVSWAMVYILASVAVSVLAVGLGLWVGRKFASPT